MASNKTASPRDPDASLGAKLFLAEAQALAKDPLSRGKPMPAALFGRMEGFLRWGRLHPMEALGFAARGADFGETATMPESIALGLAHWGALMALELPMPFELSIDDFIEVSNDDTHATARLPAFRMDDAHFAKAIPGFGRLPSSFADAAERFYNLAQHRWHNEGSSFEGAAADFALDLAASLGSMGEALRLPRAPEAFDRLRALANEATLGAELQASLHSSKRRPKAAPRRTL